MLSTEQRHEAAKLYGKLLGSALEAKGISINRLAKKLKPGQPETARRKIHRYLSGEHLPGIEQRAQLAEHLDCADLRSVPATDDEEDRSAMPSLSLADQLHEIAALAALLNAHPNLRDELVERVQ